MRGRNRTTPEPGPAGSSAVPGGPIVRGRNRTTPDPARQGHRRSPVVRSCVGGTERRPSPAGSSAVPGGPIVRGWGHTEGDAQDRPLEEHRPVGRRDPSVDPGCIRRPIRTGSRSCSPESNCCRRLRWVGPPSRAHRHHRRAGLRGAHAHPAGGHATAAGRARRAGRGTHRHGQDGRLRAADAAAYRGASCRWCGPRSRGRERGRAHPGAHPGAGHAGLRCASPLRGPVGYTGPARLWRPGHRSPAACLAPWRRCRGRHPRARRRPPDPGQSAARPGPGGHPR